MASFLHLTTLFLALIGPSFAAPPYKALVAPITQAENFFAITLSQKEKLIIDIESPFSWHHCSKSSPSVNCQASQCLASQSNPSPCNLYANIPKRPPRTCTTCLTLPYNPITKRCHPSKLSYTSVSINSTDGHNPLATVNYNKIYMACAHKSFRLSLPKGTSGFASLSKGPLSLVSQFSTTNVAKKFAMCLGDQGVAFFGEGPFFLLPPPGRNISQLLSFTPLLKHPTDKLGYYIDLKGILINGQALTFTKKTLRGGAKLSTVTPYTTLSRPIYKAVLKQFANATSGIPRVPKVAPFGLCLNTTNLGSTRVGLPVPQIDLQLAQGAQWTIFGANSMKQVSDDVACLAFVDGGRRAKQAMVIGLHQMQHNFLVFDSVESKLGFSSLLFFFQTTCNNFNFTLGAN